MKHISSASVAQIKQEVLESCGTLLKVGYSTWEYQLTDNESAMKALDLLAERILQLMEKSS